MKTNGTRYSPAFNIQVPSGAGAAKAQELSLLGGLGQWVHPGRVDKVNASLSRALGQGVRRKGGGEGPMLGQNEVEVALLKNSHVGTEHSVRA